MPIFKRNLVRCSGTLSFLFVWWDLCRAASEGARELWSASLPLGLCSDLHLLGFYLLAVERGALQGAPLLGSAASALLLLLFQYRFVLLINSRHLEVSVIFPFAIMTLICVLAMLSPASVRRRIGFFYRRIHGRRGLRMLAPTQHLPDQQDLPPPPPPPPTFDSSTTMSSTPRMFMQDHSTGDQQVGIQTAAEAISYRKERAYNGDNYGEDAGKYE